MQTHDCSWVTTDGQALKMLPFQVKWKFRRWTPTSSIWKIMFTYLAARARSWGADAA